MDKLTEFSTAAYAKCLDNMVKLMTKRGVDVATPILAKVRAPFGAPTSLAQIVRVKVPDAALVSESAPI